MVECFSIGMMKVVKQVDTEKVRRFSYFGRGQMKFCWCGHSTELQFGHMINSNSNCTSEDIHSSRNILILQGQIYL